MIKQQRLTADIKWLIGQLETGKWNGQTIRLRLKTKLKLRQ
jgi:hypothetical protein